MFRWTFYVVFQKVRVLPAVDFKAMRAVVMAEISGQSEALQRRLLSLFNTYNNHNMLCIFHFITLLIYLHRNSYQTQIIWITVFRICSS